MLNVEELEQQWIRYKIKSYIPHAVIVISSVTIMMLLLFFIDYEPKTAQGSLQNTKESVSTPVNKKAFTATSQADSNSSKSKQATEVVKMVLAPSIDFITQHKKPKPQATTTPTRQDKPKQKPVTTKPLVKVEEIPKAIAIVQKQNISIKRKNSNDDLNIIIKRFQKTNNPELSLFIAKKYYSLGKYKEAYNYALITNKINNNLEGSWIVFSKALVKLGKKRLALKVLNQYLDYADSNKAQILLDEILSGKFR